MRNIWELFRGDIERVTRNVVGIIVVAGLVVVPALYAWFNILGNWDPYQSTSGLKVAVANNDEGYQSDLVPVEVNIGNTVVATLRANDQFDWVFVSEDEAVDGVRSGAYYAAIVIPKSFSADMMTLFSTDIKHSDIVYYSNEKENAIAPRVTDEGASAVQAQVDTAFTKTVDEIGLKTISNLMSFLDGSSVGNYVTALNGSLDDATSDLDNAAAQISSFAALAGSTAQLVDSTSQVMGSTGTAASSAREAVFGTQEGLSSLAAAVSGTSAQASEAIGQVAASYDVISQNVDAAFDALAGQATSAAGTLDTSAAQVQVIIDALTELRDSSAVQGNPELVAALDRTIDALGTLKASLGQAAADLRTSSADAAAQRQAIQDLIARARQSIAEVQGLYERGLAGKLVQLEESLGAVAASSADVASSLEGTAGALSGASGSLAADLRSAQTALDGAAAGLAQISGQLKEARTELAEALAMGDVDKIRAIIGSDPERLASFLASPVGVDRHAVYGIANYGSSMASFYTVLALWVGAIILVALMKANVSEQRQQQLGALKPSELYFGRFGLFAVVALAQGVLVCGGDLLFVGIQCEHPLLFMLAGCLTSLVFSAIVYTLTVSFGDVGKALAVVLLVMQVAGTGGIFPVQMLAEPIQAIYPFLPFTHAIDAMHACVGGIYGTEYWVSIGCLLLFLAPTLLLGLVLRRPIAGLNQVVQKKLEETGFM